MNGEVDDREIVGRVLSGDTDAFRLLVDRYSDRLWRFCRARLGDDSDAEDAVQDVFVRAFRSLRSFKPTGSWSSWLFAIAANRVKSRYASNTAKARLLERAGMEAVVLAEDAGVSPDPAMLALDVLASERLRSAVASLQAVAVQPRVQVCRHRIPQVAGPESNRVRMVGGRKFVPVPRRFPARIPARCSTHGFLAPGKRRVWQESQPG
jgi:RNA polymerase sigma factor (sigma-70 family)